MELVLASGNAKKLAELRLALSGIDVRLLAPSDVGGLPEVVEDLPTFAGNAARKARAAALHTGRWALADDSGLEVDALGGAPGVLSARFAGRHGDDAANNRLLLERLSDVPDERRGARFVCALALAAACHPLRLVDATNLPHSYAGWRRLLKRKSRTSRKAARPRAIQIGSVIPPASSGAAPASAATGA
jgi:XTP/dITP diphosphohydrolase